MPIFVLMLRRYADENTAVHALWASRLTRYFEQRYHKTKEEVKAIPAEHCFVALV